MEHEERIRLLLHPEQYSDEQLQQMLADDPELMELLDELALTKQAFVGRETDEETIPVEEEWQRFLENEGLRMKNEKFAAAQVGNNTTTAQPHSSLFTLHSSLYKIAASFIGVLLVSGIAFAAIRIVHHSQQPQAKPTADTTAAADSSLFTIHSSLSEDTTDTAQPIVFDNTPLEKMLPQIAAHYHKEVEFANDNARQLRFYFVWKPEEGIEITLHRLNLFESVNIELKDNKIIVE